MALGSKHKWVPEEVQSIREDKKTMTVTQLMEKYQLRRAQVAMRFTTTSTPVLTPPRTKASGGG
jgi:hypothetical protein